MDNMVIALVGVGEYFVNDIKYYYKDLKEWGFNVKVLTDNPNEFESGDVTLYDKPLFNYFDKLYFSLKIGEETKKTVVYIDGSSQINKNTIINITERQTTDFTYFSSWPGGDFFIYKDYPCFNYIMDYLKIKNLPIIDYPTILEQIMVFNKTINHHLVKEELCRIQPALDYMSVMDDKTQKVIGASEGLALSIVLSNNNITFQKQDILPYSIYIISLKSDIERRKHMEELMGKLNLKYEFFDAIESEEITDEIEMSKFSDVDYYQYNVNQLAVMATFLSHMTLIRKSNKEKINMLIFEDDVDIINSFDFSNVNFNEFDMYNIGSNKVNSVDCHSYFVSYEGAGKIVNHIDNTRITQAFDWEMVKVKDIKYDFIDKPVFIQLKDKFKSNLAPNGYENNKMSLG